MKRIGLALDTLEHSELNYYSFKYANHIINQGLADVVCFYKQNGIPLIKPMFSCMQFAESFSYYGNIIATSFNTAHSLIKNPFVKKKFFFCWDLDWFRYPKHYNLYAQVYLNEEFHIIARTDYAAKVIENSWNRKVTLVTHDFNLERLLEYAA